MNRKYPAQSELGFGRNLEHRAGEGLQQQWELLLGLAFPFQRKFEKKNKVSQSPHGNMISAQNKSHPRGWRNLVSRVQPPSLLSPKFSSFEPSVLLSGEWVTSWRGLSIPASGGGR